MHGDANAADIVIETYTNKYGEVAKEDVGGAVMQYAYFLRKSLPIHKMLLLLDNQETQVFPAA